MKIEHNLKEKKNGPDRRNAMQLITPVNIETSLKWNFLCSPAIIFSEVLWDAII